MNFQQAKKLNVMYAKLDFFKYTKQDLARLVCVPENDANKYSRGVCNVVAGDKNYPGAAILCVGAAERSGAGFTRLFTHWLNRLHSAFKVTTIPVKSFWRLSAKFIAKQNNCSFVVGPGFTPGNRSERAILNKVLARSLCPVIVDGGALSGVPDWNTFTLIKQRSKAGLHTIFTPHFGEALRIANKMDLLDPDQDPKNINPAKLCFSLSYVLKSIVVLKGSQTYVCNGKKMYYCDFGSAALSKAGTGDVLAGIIGAITCQHQIKPFNACCLGVATHAIAGKIAEEKLSIVSVTAADVIKTLPRTFKYLLDSEEQFTQ